MATTTDPKSLNHHVEAVKKGFRMFEDASEAGSSRKMAFVLVGEPGNGKTFFVDYLCARYREFLSVLKNMKYTFRFKNFDRLGGYGKINVIESQTYEKLADLIEQTEDGLKGKSYLDGFILIASLTPMG